MCKRCHSPVMVLFDSWSPHVGWNWNTQYFIAFQLKPFGEQIKKKFAPICNKNGRQVLNQLIYADDFMDMKTNWLWKGGMRINYIFSCNFCEFFLNQYLILSRCSKIMSRAMKKKANTNLTLFYSLWLVHGVSVERCALVEMCYWCISCC